ncbi:hypothetical protein [Sphingobacterium sp. ML3W]|uniref:hypothetical protein n=1 Tax=Sphingobacterium sp. ML3W TaxID=1538644 RepID=UPI001185642C|nr:hypothetical protein [Sphingobacterium sp. ML3W]
MKKWINKINNIVQVVLMAPVKLPGKVMHILKYIGLGLGVIEMVLEEPEDKAEQAKDGIVRQSETARFLEETSNELLSPTRTTDDKEVRDEV